MRRTHHIGASLTFSGRQTENEALRVHPKTALIQLQNGRSFLRWAVTEGYIAHDPSSGLMVAMPKTAKTQKSRRPFSAVELQRLFSAPLFVGCQSRGRRLAPGTVVIRDAEYWLPYLGLYTGAPLPVSDARMFVSYLRVSTQRQGDSGLGLEAQSEAVERYASQVERPIISTFTEVESGTQKDRPELAKALALCRQRKAVLLIARLDRLSRSLSFVAQLLESNVEIKAADMPEANRMMLQMLAVFAEHERRLISERTKAALAAAKARGVKLGKNGAVLAAAHRAEATAFAETLRSEIGAAHAAGHRSSHALATWLNDRNLSCRGGGRWHPATVARVLDRLATPISSTSSGGQTS